MPDDDIVPRGVRRPWRRVAELVLGGHEPETIGDALRRAIPAAVRAEKLLKTDELARRLRESAVFHDPARWTRARRDYLNQSSAGPLAMAIVAEGDRLLESRGAELRAMSDAQVTQAMNSGGLSRGAEAAVWGSEEMTRKILRGGEQSLDDRASFQQRCLDRAQIDELAERLAKQPGEKVRAPRRETPPPTTAEMLSEEVS